MEQVQRPLHDVEEDWFDEAPSVRTLMRKTLGRTRLRSPAAFAARIQMFRFSLVGPCYKTVPRDPSLIQVDFLRSYIPVNVYRFNDCFQSIVECAGFRWSDCAFFEFNCTSTSN